MSNSAFASAGMKRILPTILLLLVSSAARAETFVVDKPYEVLARVLQDTLDELAIDGLLEAKRGSAAWQYAIQTRAEKTWIEEVRVTLRQVSAHSTEVEIEAVRIEGGLLFKNKRRLSPDAEAEWTNRIRALLERK